MGIKVLPSRLAFVPGTIGFSACLPVALARAGMGARMVAKLPEMVRVARAGAWIGALVAEELNESESDAGIDAGTEADVDVYAWVEVDGSVDVGMEVDTDGADLAVP